MVKKNILLVENNTNDQVLFFEAISQIENAELIAIARNGKDALAKLENPVILPDLIFMDLDMPVMDGIECLAEIIKKPGIKDIPVVILSSETEKAELAQKLGAKAFIEKQADEKILQVKLEQIINLDFIVDSAIAKQTFQSAY